MEGHTAHRVVIVNFIALSHQVKVSPPLGGKHPFLAFSRRQRRLSATEKPALGADM